MREPEFDQAVKEFLSSVSAVAKAVFGIAENKILERLIEPDRVIQFRVTWVDDAGRVQINRAWRVQFNAALGPYKGGLRFHPTVNLSILKFLGFEQIFKNALTGLPLGGAKGGSDFDPKGKSDGEVMRFCQAFMQGLFRYIGSDRDVPAGDIGVGGREIGYLLGEYKRLADLHDSGVLTGKGLGWGGSEIRTEATGYGLLYFVSEMLDLKGKRILISGSGNVAQYAAEKAIQMGAKVLTMSDSDGYIFDPDGIGKEELEFIKVLKNERRGRLSEYVSLDSKAKYVKGKKPWGEKADIALPCATQNEIDLPDAKLLVKNGVKLVAEGANMPCTLEAVDYFIKKGVLFAPAKAANAGGVAVSGLEMSQNSERSHWTREQVDADLKKIMKHIHAQCVEYGRDKNGKINYVKGANLAAFARVSKAMLAQGLT
ncbi:MAG TPA: NADP-specific glutamate dehydrogenase [Candidatus Paceibacterota bacterium]